MNKKIIAFIAITLISIFASADGGISSGGDGLPETFPHFTCLSFSETNSSTKYAVTASSDKSYTDDIKMDVVDLNSDSSGFLLGAEEVQSSLHFRNGAFEITYQSSKIHFVLVLAQSKFTQIPNHYDAVVSTFTKSDKDLVNKSVYCTAQVSR